MITRRALLTGLIASPFVIRTPGLLMPVRALQPPLAWGVDFETGDITVFPFGPLPYGLFDVMTLHRLTIEEIERVTGIRELLS